MVSVVRSRFFRGLIAFMLAGAALIVGCYGVLLLVESFNGHGSPEGNFVLFGLALTLLVLSTCAFIFGPSIGPHPRPVQKTRTDELEIYGSRF